MTTDNHAQERKHMKKKSKATPDTIVGIFVIVGLIAINLVTILIRDGLFGSTVRVQATFESVPGLEVGAPVLVSGIRSGRVAAIDYIPASETNRVLVTDPDGTQRVLPPQPVLVTMIVNDKVPIYTNARVQLVQQGFIGDKRVEIDPGNPEEGETYTDRMQALRGQQQFDLDAIIQQASSIVDDIQASVQSFRTIIADDDNIALVQDTVRNVNLSVQRIQSYLDANEENVNAAVADIRVVSANMRDLTERMNTILEEGGQFDMIVTDVQGTVSDTRREIEVLTGQLQESINGLNRTMVRLESRGDEMADSAVLLMDGAREDINQLSRNLGETSTNLNEMITRVREGEGTVGRLFTDPTPFENLRDSTEALNNFITGSGPRRGTSMLEYPAGPRATDHQ